MVSPSPRAYRLQPTRIALAIALAFTATQSYAQLGGGPIDKLSDRLARLQPQSGDLHTAWVTDPSLQLQQLQLKQRILAQLEHFAAHKAISNLANILDGMSVTGRMPSAQSEVAALFADASADYSLTPRSTAALRPIPNAIMVLGGEGPACQIRVDSSLPIEAVLEQCQFADPSDEAWVVQADGSVFHLFTSPWNTFAQTPVAPGAWVWRPPRKLQHLTSLHAEIAQFLATQALPSGGTNESGASLASMPDPQTNGRPTHTNTELGWKPLISSNDWGETGLLQTPTARSGELGSVRFSLSRVSPYTRMNVFFQPTAWLEFGFRYTDIASALYGPDIAGDQTYKDKSFDFKAILVDERAHTPQIAVGMRDIGGTGLFSSEYLVASKRTESLDWSLGIGWGNMAASGKLSNPLGALFPSLKQRQVDSLGQGGTIGTTSMFAGNAALFGGVQWTAPSGKTAVKLEFEGNDYTLEPFAQNLGASSPFNVGWLYRLTPGTDISLSWERGNRLALSLTLSGNLRTASAPKPFDAPPPTLQQIVKARVTDLPPLTSAWDPQMSEVASGKPARSVQSVQATLQTQIHAQTGWKLLSFGASSGVWQLHVETDDAYYAAERLDKLFAVLATELPSEGTTVEIYLSNFGLPLRSVRFDRSEWLAQKAYPNLPSLQLASMEWLRPVNNSLGSNEHVAHSAKSALGLETGWGTTFSHILGGPNSFLLYQAGLRAYSQYRFNENTWAFGQTNLRLADNYDTFVYDAPSNLPRVRTDQRSYVTTSRVTIPVAQLTRTFDLGSGHYASAYGGLLEPMYAGIGGEWLWRPWQSHWALGFDINQVQQRAYEQDLRLREYQTTTGHAALYWDTGFNGVIAKLFAGKYLAKDTGVTLDISRPFSNGASIGIWATKTNVSAEQFGEGSFDKGIYLTVPLDAVLPKSNSATATFVWNPLTRDGGARLGRRFPLFDLTRQADSGVWRYRMSTPESANTEEAEEFPSLWAAASRSRIGQPGLGDAFALGPALIDSRLNYRNLIAGTAAIALTMALDKPLAHYAGNSGASTAQTTQSLNAIPYVLAAGAGAAALGLGGEDVQTTAFASLSAATWALGANLVGKSIIGRARPDEGQGPWAFNGPSNTSPQSSFASNHVTAAMALATPFAQRYNQPWLYGLAAMTAVGRIESNDHWASDTVAGALLGYAFGSLALDNQTQKAKQFKVGTTGNQVVVTMKY